MEHLKNKNYEISILYLNKAINKNAKNSILYEKSKNHILKVSGAQNYLQLGLFKVTLDDALKCIELDKTNKNVSDICFFFFLYFSKSIIF